MIPLIQRLPLNEDSSFIARTYRTPHFEVGWHQHIEYELILFTEGAGLSFVGNHVGKFDTGDIYCLGSQLPHTFQKHDPEQVASAIVIQFREDCWGREFLEIPESRSIRAFLDISGKGLKLHGSMKEDLTPLIRKLETARGFQRILLLGECLHQMAGQNSHTPLSTQEIKVYNPKDAACIDSIYRFTIDNFKEEISLAQVAAIACLSIPAFCNYFKQRTQKTYIDFLNEVRIGYACSLLLQTQKSVIDICYDSGYNTMANFHKQFLKNRKTTPLQYRKQFAKRAYSFPTPPTDAT